MANLNKKQSCRTKAFMFQDLLNFSESSDDESIPTSGVPAKSQTTTPKDVHGFTSAKTKSCGKENVQIKAQKLGKKVNEYLDHVSPFEEKTVSNDGKVSRANVKKDFSRPTGGKVPRTGVKETVSKLTGGKVFRTDVKEATNKGVSEKGQQIRSTKKTGACIKSKPKKTFSRQNTTLASLGISFDFSASSDEDEECAQRERRMQSIVQNADGKQPCDQKENPANNKRPDRHSESKVVGKAVVEDDAGADMSPCPSSEASEGKAGAPSAVCSEAKVITRTDVAKQDLHISDNLNPSRRTEPSSEPAGFKHQKTTHTVSSTGQVHEKFSSMKTHSDSIMAHILKSGHRKTKLGKDNLCRQHPDISVIRSAHMSGSLTDLSPLDESLLPLSESTRLDGPENCTNRKQSFGHLLAHQNSPKLPDRLLGHSQDSSYEQFKIVHKNVSESEERKRDNITDKNEGLKTEAGGEKPGSFVTELSEVSENGSQYVTCLASPDVSSMYEAVDVSIQTSFSFEVAANAVKKDVDKLDLHDAKQSKLSDKLVCGDNSVNAMASKQSEDCAEIPADPCKSIDIDLASLQIEYGSDKSEEKKDEQVKNESRDDRHVVTDNVTENVEATVGQKKTSKSRAKPALLPNHSPELRHKHLSDSNYFSDSESRIDKDTAVDKCKWNTENHQACTSVNIELQSTHPGNEITKEPEFGSTVGDLDGGKKKSLSDVFSTENNEMNGDVALNSRNVRTARARSSSSNDSDDELEKFFQKMRTPARPVKDISEDDDLDDFIVNDSDVTDSDEDVCYADLTRRLDRDDCDRHVQPASGKRPSSRKKQANLSSSEDEVDDNSDVDDSDSDEGEVEEGDDYAGLRTPRVKSQPTFSHSQTPREASPKWYTPATSRKTKPKLGHALCGDNKPTVPSTRLQGEEAHSYSSWRTPASAVRGTNKNVIRPLGFLRSLSNDVPDSVRDEEARGYIVHFKRRQEELSSRLFKLFNFTVFENKLPADMPVVWNKRLLKTAGLCKQKRVGDKYTASIELSTKVCDTAERIRDTLVHEMCHAAVWVVNRMMEGHGKHWRYWAKKANRAHPEIPIIRVCHDYSISTKYIYKCVQCGYQIGRHSKSLDTEKKVCGHCRGHFQLLVSKGGNTSSASQPATPRTPNPFAMFVKENYGSVKKQGHGLAHKEVMEALSKQFARTKLNFS